MIFECSADTIRRVETLVNTGDIDETQNCVSLTNVQAFGVQYYNALQSERPDSLGVFFINALRFWLDHRFEYDYKSKKKRRFGLCIRIASGHPEWVWNDKITCIIGEYHAEHKVR